MITITFTLKNAVAINAPAIIAIDIALFSFTTLAPRFHTTSHITAATPACIPPSTAATHGLVANAL